jgi:hypothetical protein
MLPALRDCAAAIALQAGLKRSSHDQDDPDSRSQVRPV